MSDYQKLRHEISRMADEARWAQTQEGSKVHDACEGHAVCDLIARVMHTQWRIEVGEL